MKMNNEIKIGIMVFICLVALLLLTLRVGSFSFYKKGYNIKVQFQNIDGMELSGPVRLNGLEVGMVEDVKIAYEDSTKMILTLWINEGAKIRQGAKAYIKTMGLIGEKYVGIMDRQEGPFLEPGALIVGEEPFELEKLLGRSDKIAENLESTSQNLDEFSDDVKRHPWKLLFRTEDKNK